MKNMKYVTPEAEILMLSNIDVLTASDNGTGGFDGKEDGVGGGSGGGEIEAPVLPTSYYDSLPVF